MVLPAEGRQWTWEILKAALFSLMTYLKLFKNQNRVTVVQTCKMEPGGCCGYDFRCIPSSLRTWTGFPGSSAGKESTCNAEDPSSIPGSGRAAGEGKGYPLQYSGLENSTDCIVHGVTKSWTWLNDFHFTYWDIFTYHAVHSFTSWFLTIGFPLTVNTSSMYLIWYFSRSLESGRDMTQNQKSSQRPSKSSKMRWLYLIWKYPESFPPWSQTHTSSWLLERSNWIIRNIKLYFLKT